MIRNSLMLLLLLLFTEGLMALECVPAVELPVAVLAVVEEGVGEMPRLHMIRHVILRLVCKVPRVKSSRSEQKLH